MADRLNDRPHFSEPVKPFLTMWDDAVIVREVKISLDFHEPFARYARCHRKIVKTGTSGPVIIQVR